MLVRLIIRRLLALILVLIGLSIVTFVLSHIVPGDPARLIAGPRAGQQAVENIRHQYGLDRPLYEQYVSYLKGIVTLDFGTSLSSLRPVRSDLGQYFPATVELALAALVLSLVIGFPLGILSAVRPNSLVDYLSRLVSITGIATPIFWMALLAQFAFFVRLKWLPDGGRLPPGATPPQGITGLYTVDSLLEGNWSLFVTALKYLVLPACVLAYSTLPLITRQLRGAMLEVLGQDYIRTARAKGLRERGTILHHALRNAMLPVVTILGLQVGLLFSGAVLIEIVFSWPGIGRYALTGVTNFDYNAIMAVTLVIGFCYVIINMFADIAYMLLDPRISLG